MKLPVRKAYVVRLAALLAIPVAVVAVAVGYSGVAIALAVILLVLVLFALLDVREGQLTARTAAAASHRRLMKALQRIERRVDNIALREVTEARASEIAIVARLDSIQKQLDNGAE
ncbi:MAG: hypothetical protein QOJ72_1759 [Nocardioidaceae bacterium]|jgi:predicted negative regulator of RcsB-dependent stress response|nr:hypothetical protein [Nocardioidaceae bacterium]